MIKSYILTLSLSFTFMITTRATSQLFNTNGPMRGAIYTRQGRPRRRLHSGCCLVCHLLKCPRPWGVVHSGLVSLPVVGGAHDRKQRVASDDSSILGLLLPFGWRPRGSYRMWNASNRRADEQHSVIKLRLSYRLDRDSSSWYHQ